MGERNIKPIQVLENKMRLFKSKIKESLPCGSVQHASSNFQHEPYNSSDMKKSKYLDTLKGTRFFQFLGEVKGKEFLMLINIVCAEVKQ